MKLTYDATGTEVKVGDEVFIKEGGVRVGHRITEIQKPRHGGSTGRVYVKAADEPYSHGYYPSIVGATWVEREDQVDDEHIGVASYGQHALAQQTGRSVVLQDGFGSFVVEL